LLAMDGLENGVSGPKSISIVWVYSWTLEIAICVDDVVRDGGS